MITITDKKWRSFQRKCPMAGTIQEAEYAYARHCLAIGHKPTSEHIVEKWNELLTFLSGTKPYLRRQR